MTDLLDILTFVVATIAAVFSFIMWRISRKEELSMLKALYDHLGEINKSAIGHERQFLMTHILPSWPIPNMDVNYYLTKISYKVRKETSLMWISTRKLKKNLIKVHERVNTINFLWKQAADGCKTDLYSNTYYSDLNNDILLVQEQIQKLCWT